MNKYIAFIFINIYKHTGICICKYIYIYMYTFRMTHSLRIPEDEAVKGAGMMELCWRKHAFSS